MSQAKSAEKVVQEIRRKTRRRFSAEEKIRIVLEGLRGEESIATLCRREGLNPNLYYRWSKEFLEAGKKRLVGDTTREATSTDVTGLRHENGRLLPASRTGPGVRSHRWQRSARPHGPCPRKAVNASRTYFSLPCFDASSRDTQLAGIMIR